MYETFRISSRKDSRLITPVPSSNYSYMSSNMWNKYQQSTGIEDFTVPIGYLKSMLKRCLLEVQKKYGVDWCDLNFTEFCEV